jgi:protein ImuB
MSEATLFRFTKSDDDLGVERDARANSSRKMIIWVPDWPVVAAAAQHGVDPQRPLAVVDHGEIFACSAAARVEGVRRGMRRRDAAARCPELTVLDRAAEHEVRTFEIVLSAVEEIAA